MSLILEILIDGKNLTANAAIESLSMKREFNKIPKLRIAFMDGGITEESFGVLKSLKATPGSEIEIKLGYTSASTIFKGIVVKNHLTINEGEYLVEVEASDKAIQMTSGRLNEIYQKKKDSDIFNDLVKKYSGLSVKSEATTVTHDELVQFSCSNWDFMLMRAEANGMFVLVNDSAVNIAKPDISKKAKTVLENGVNVISVNLEVDSTLQYSSVKVVGWDGKKQETLEEEVKGTFSPEFGNVSTKKMSKVVNKDGYHLNTSIQVASDKLKAWGEAKLTKSAMNMVKGTIEVIGTPDILPGDVVEVSGFGKDFSGKLIVTGVEHFLQELAWTTILTFGMPFTWFAESVNDAQVPSASGIVAPIHGLCTGTVMSIHEDNDGQFRVRVSLKVLGSEKGNIYVSARMSNLYATKEAGTFFYPEVNDEVLLGFLNADPHQPVILGMLYSDVNKTPFPPDDKNQFKAIVSREKITIKMDDVDKILTISTPGENIITLDDKEGQIVLTDKNKNTITMSKDGVTIESAKDIIMKAKGNIQMEAQSNIEMKATADLKGAGMNVTLEAQTGLTAKGSATAELSASGQTTVKGGIVMIN